MSVSCKSRLHLFADTGKEWPDSAHYVVVVVVVAVVVTYA